MKKNLTSLVLVFAILSYCVNAFANSGPTFWEGQASSDIMVIQKDSPIGVKEETLEFDLSDNRDFDHTLGGRVTASYKMTNPTGKPQSVQMVFPIIAKIDELFREDIVITANGKSVPYAIFLGSVVKSYGDPYQKENEPDFDFGDIVKTINNDVYNAKSFGAYQKGKLYTIEVKPAKEQRINFVVDFSFDKKKTKVLTKGFNRYERNGENTRIASWCYEPESLEIYVLGDDIGFEFSGFSDGELKQKTDLFAYQISDKGVEFKTYLMEHLLGDADVTKGGMLSETQVYNLYAKTLDRYFEINQGYGFKEDLNQQSYYQRIISLVYSVDFSPQSEQEVTVSYKTSGTMDKSKAANAIYTFDYILNPAKNWGDFGNLNIRVKTPTEAPYIIKSTVDFTRAGDNVYTATLEGLPEKDLSFTLYDKEKITFSDRIGGQLKGRFRYLTPFATFGLMLALILNIMGFVMRKIKSKTM